MIECILGTRPEAMKVLPVVRELRAMGGDVRVVFTSQHADMAEDVFRAFGIFPDIILPCEGKGSMSERLAGMLRAFVTVSPALASMCDCILVQGDTLSAFAGGVHGFLSQIPVVHLEAGLRSHDVGAPYPEEALRRALAALARLHLCTTPFAVQNLLCEGVARTHIRLVGNTVEDALCTLLPSVTPYRKPAGRYLWLMTLHRRECDSPTRRAMLAAVREVLGRFPTCELVLPVHKSPAVREDVTAILGAHPRVYLTPPLSPTDFYGYLVSADLILTDSGGVQEEAVLLGHHPLVLREVTEREEELYRGRLTLVGTSPARIRALVAARVHALLSCPPCDGCAVRERTLAHVPSSAAQAAREILAVRESNT